MVTVSQRQYDEMVDLIHRLQQDTAGDDFTQDLGRRFDAAGPETTSLEQLVLQLGERGRFSAADFLNAGSQNFIIINVY